MKSEDVNNPIHILGVEKITQRPHVNLFEIRYSDKKGRNRKWDTASRCENAKCAAGHFDLPDAVMITAIHAELRRLVVIREFRVPLGAYQYGFPAGLLDPGESIEETCIREMREETGLEIARLLSVSPPLYSSPGMTDESIVMVHAECTGTPSSRLNESTEDIETILVSPDDAGRLCADNRLMFDARAWLVMAFFANTGRIRFAP